MEGTVDHIYPWCDWAEPVAPYDTCERCEQGPGLLVWEVMIDPDYDESCRVCTPCAATLYTHAVLTAAAKRCLS